MKKHIPNTITLINLFCGCAALVSIFYGQFLTAIGFTFAGAIADYLDGMVARLLNVHSELGKELDSMADMVSFGAVPGAILYILLVISQTDPNITNFENIALPNQLTLSALPAFLVSVFSGLRLAKFNIDTRQSDSFIGLNTPATTLFIVGLLLTAYYDNYGLRSFILNPYLLYGISIVLAYLLVAELPMMSFKFKKFTWKDNEQRFIFILLSIILLGVFQSTGLCLVIIAYILLSLWILITERA